MNDSRNIKADLVAERVSAQEKLLQLLPGESITRLSVRAAAKFAEVDRRTWQRWEAAGELPKAALERFRRRVEEAAAAKGRLA